VRLVKLAKVSQSATAILIGLPIAVFLTSRFFTMNNSTLIKKATGFFGTIALAATMSLPAFAQVTPRPTTPNPNRPSNQAPGRLPGPGNSTTPGADNPTAPGTTQTSPTTRPTAGALLPLDREFAIMAAQSNNAEIATSQLALQRSQNANVRQYAQRMIQEHTQANQRLEQLTRGQGITLPRDAGPFNNAVAQRLAQFSGTEFDQAYLGTQVNAHIRTVGLLQTQIQQGQNEGLQSYASQVLPSVRDHLQVATQLAPNYRAGTVNILPPTSN
jgi:putative membrane protein